MEKQFKTWEAFAIIFLMLSVFALSVIFTAAQRMGNAGKPRDKRSTLKLHIRRDKASIILAGWSGTVVYPDGSSGVEYIGPDRGWLCDIKLLRTISKPWETKLVLAIEKCLASVRQAACELVSHRMERQKLTQAVERLRKRQSNISHLLAKETAPQVLRVCGKHKYSAATVITQMIPHLNNHGPIKR